MNVDNAVISVKKKDDIRLLNALIKISNQYLSFIAS